VGPLHRWPNDRSFIARAPPDGPAEGVCGDVGRRAGMFGCLFPRVPSPRGTHSVALIGCAESVKLGGLFFSQNFSITHWKIRRISIMEFIRCSTSGSLAVSGYHSDARADAAFLQPYHGHSFADVLFTTLQLLPNASLVYLQIRPAVAELSVRGPPHSCSTT
jgi:hypothetical protein